MMRVHTVVLIAVLSMTALSSTAEAHRGGGPQGFFGPGADGAFPGPRLLLEHMADHLDLSDEQRENVRSIVEAAKPEFEALREQLRGNREALESLAIDDPSYSTQLNNIAMLNGQLATEGTLLFTRVRNEVHAVLTDEQRDKLARGKERMRGALEKRGNSR